MLTWPDRPAVCAVAVIVDVLVDHAPGSAEQVHEFGGEAGRPTSGRGCSSPLTSLMSASPAAPGNNASPSLSMLARPSRAVCAASAQPQCRLAGAPLFQLAAMARTASWGTLSTMPVRCLIVDDNHDFLRAATRSARARWDQRGWRRVDRSAGIPSPAGSSSRTSSLIDIDLGEETGFEVARQLASELGPQQPRVILISAYSEDDFET